MIISYTRVPAGTSQRLACDATTAARPQVAVPTDPVEALWARNRAQGLTLHARSLTPSWLGERLDLAWALDVLHPLANPVVSRSPSGFM